MAKIKRRSRDRILGIVGDRILIGILLGVLESVSPERCYEYIKNDLELLHWSSDTDWEKYRNIAKKANIGRIAKEITRERVITDLRKHRPDLLDVILNTPQGQEWLDKQMTTMKEKLGA